MALFSYALTTVARFKEYAGVTATSAEDIVIEQMINQVTTFIERYTRVRFMETVHENEEYSSDGGESLLLNNYPISKTADFTLQYRTSLENKDNWETIDSENYFIDYNAGVISDVYRNLYLVRRYYFRVSYTAGYSFDNSATFLSDTAAGDVEYATWKLVNEAWEQRKTGRDINSEKLGDYAISYARSLFELGRPQGNFVQPVGSIQAILDRYKRSVVTSVLTPINT